MKFEGLLTPPTGDTVNASDINAQKSMQLATSSDAHPWVCTVYFIVRSGNFYWISLPDRRHSQELTANPSVAIAVALQPAQPVVGIQAEGEAEAVNDTPEIKAVLEQYVAKYGQGRSFVELFLAGKNKHILYRMRPNRVVLFDERDQTTLPQREVTIT